MLTDTLPPAKSLAVKFLSRYPADKTDTASAFAVLQCSPETDKLFLSYKEAGQSVNLADYDFIKAYELTDTYKKKPKTEILDSLFQSFNINKPADFEGHSMSVSDIIALRVPAGIEFHFVDSVGFVHLEEKMLYFDFPVPCMARPFP